MKSDARGHFATEDLIEIAQRLVAALQDAGVTHVRDVAVTYQPTDNKGLDVDVGTLAGPVDVLPLDCGHLAREMAVSKIAVLRPTPGRRPRRPARPRHDQSA
jgi:hypothetical protein